MKIKTFLTRLIFFADKAGKPIGSSNNYDISYSSKQNKTQTSAKSCLKTKYCTQAV